MLPVLDGVVMELQDCALPLLRGEPVCPSKWGAYLSLFAFFFLSVLPLLRREPVCCSQSGIVPLLCSGNLDLTKLEFMCVGSLCLVLFVSFNLHYKVSL